MKKANKLAIGGFALLTLAGSACAPKRQFADNHLHGDKIQFSETKNKNVPYQKERETMFFQNYYFKEADNNYKNSLDFELAPEDLTYDRINPKKGKVKVDFVEEFVPIRQKNSNGTWATQVEIIDYKAAIKDIPIKNKFKKTIITENGKKYKLPTIIANGKEYLITKSVNQKPATLALYFIPFNENLDLLIDSKGNITIENKVDGLYRPILDQKDTKQNKEIIQKIGTEKYRIKYWDTYWKLAEEIYGTGRDANKLMELNNTKNSKLIVGQYINIPKKD